MASTDIPKAQTKKQEKILNDFIKQYSALIKKQQMTFDQAVDEITTTLKAHPDFNDYMMSRKEIEVMVGDKQKLESGFNKTVTSIKENMDELVDTNQKSTVDQKTFTDEMIETSKDSKYSLMAQSQGTQELVEYAKQQTNDIASSNKALEVIQSGISSIRTPGEGVGELFDYGKGEISSITADNDALEIGGVLFKSLQGFKNDISSGLEDNSDDTNQLLEDINDSILLPDTTTYDDVSQTQMLGDIGDKLDDQIDLSYDSYLRDLRVHGERKKQDDIEADVMELHLKELKYNAKQRGKFSWLQRFLIGSVVGAAVGAWIGSIFLPFQVIMQTLGMEAMDVAELFNQIAQFGWKMIKKLRNITPVIASTLDSIISVLRNIFMRFKPLQKVVASITDTFSKVDVAGKTEPIATFLDTLYKKFKANNKVFNAVGDSFDDFVAVFTNSFTKISKSSMKLAATWREIKFFIFNIDKVLTKTLRNLGAHLEKMGGALKWVGKFLTGFTKFLQPLRTIFFPMLSGLYAGLRWGIQKLAVPLQIVLSFIDFIKGFSASLETTFLGKVKDGLINVVMVFFELPVKLFGWMVDKVLGWFGAELKGGTANKIFDYMRYVLEAMLYPLKMVSEFIGGVTDFFKNGIEAMKALFAGDYDALERISKAMLGNIKTMVISMFKALFNMPIQMYKLMMDYKPQILKVFKAIGMQLLLLPITIARTAPKVIAAALKLWAKGLKIALRIIIYTPYFLAKLAFKAIKWGNKMFIKGIKALWDHILGIPGRLLDSFKSIGEMIGQFIDGVKKLPAELWKTLKISIDDAVVSIKQDFEEVWWLIAFIPKKILSFIKGVNVKIMDSFSAFGDYLISLPAMLINVIKAKIRKIPGIGRLIGGAEEITGAVTETLTNDTVKTQEMAEMGADEIAGAARGGLTLTEGLAYLHPNELIGPANQIIPQIINEVMSTPVGSMVADVISSKGDVIKNQYNSQKTVESILNSTNRGMENARREQANATKGLDITEGKMILEKTSQNIDPPPDIEALGLLFFNKAWGVG